MRQPVSTDQPAGLSAGEQASGEATSPPIAVRRAATIARGGTLRLTLTRAWDDRPKVCFIGHNPSTADAQTDDPTVRRWMHFARAWGYGGFVAVNLYPFRSPDVREVYRWADWDRAGPAWDVRDAIWGNRDVVTREAKAAGLVVACWGAIARDDSLVEAMIEEVMCGEEPWPSIYVFGLTKGGAPIHPMARGKLRIPDDAKPVLWRGNG